MLCFGVQLGRQIAAKAQSAGSWVVPPHVAVSLRGLLSSCHVPRTLSLASCGTPGPPSSSSSEDYPLSDMGCIVSLPKEIC